MSLRLPSSHPCFLLLFSRAEWKCTEMFHFFNQIYFHTLVEKRVDFWLVVPSQWVWDYNLGFLFSPAAQPTHHPIVTYILPLGWSNEFDLLYWESDHENIVCVNTNDDKKMFLWKYPLSLCFSSLFNITEIRHSFVNRNAFNKQWSLTRRGVRQNKVWEWQCDCVVRTVSRIKVRTIMRIKI